MSIKIFYDGSDRIEEYLDKVDGVTTNIGFLKKSGISDYESFIKDTISLNKDNKPISFQVFSDTVQGMRSQALKIASFSSEVFVKVPVVGPHGETTQNLVKELIFEHDLNINITCIYTKDQIDSLGFLDNVTRPAIISIFSGRIGDTGHDPLDIVNYAVSKFRNNQNIQVLWAGCQRVYDILTAERSGCHIITVPEGVLKKKNRLGVSLDSFSLKTSYDFHMDGKDLFL